MSDLEQHLLWQLKAVGLPVPEREVRVVPERRFRFDFVYRDARLAIEVDGGLWGSGRHQRPEGYERDAEKGNLAVLAGWRVLHVTGRMITDGTAIELIQRALATPRDPGTQLGTRT